MAVVVGGGPSGLFAVGALLDGGAPSVAWVDAAAVDGAGRLKVYAAVPSNTKTGLFVRALTEGACFASTWEELARRGRGQSLERLRALPADSTCALGLAADALAELAAGVLDLHAARVRPYVARVTSIDGATANDGAAGHRVHWTVRLAAPADPASAVPSELTATVVVLATGSAPVLPTDSAAPHVAYGLPAIPLDDALDPARLAAALARLPAGPASHRVAVLGSSHSAVLVLKNLHEADGAAVRITNFYRSPFIYAEYIDQLTILNDNTGLKGTAAAWARAHLEDGCPAPLDRLRRVRTTQETEKAVYAAEIPAPASSIVAAEERSGSHGGCDAVVYAVGYARSPLPAIALDGVPAAAAGAGALDYLPDGQLVISTGGSGPRTCAGLYGFGIAFPQRIRGSDGAPDLAVGLWKFIQHIRASLSAQTDGAGRLGGRE